MSSSLTSIPSYILLGAVFIALLLIVYKSWRNGISPMPASAKVRHAVAGEINRLSSIGTIVEAGSGWGTLVFYLARYCPEWKIVGIENSAVPLWISQLYLRFLVLIKDESIKQTSILRGDIYAYPYKNTDVVVCYLYPGAMKRLSEILDQMRSTDVRIISVCFALPGRQPERIVTCQDLLRTKVYVY